MGSASAVGFTDKGQATMERKIIVQAKGYLGSAAEKVISRTGLLKPLTQ
jgi:hypothetical protein